MPKCLVSVYNKDKLYSAIAIDCVKSLQNNKTLNNIMKHMNFDNIIINEKVK